MSRKKIRMLNGERVRARRKKRGFSQAYLAAAVDISVRQLSRYETGEPVDVSASVLIKLAEELQCSTDYLLNLTDDPVGFMPEIPADMLRLARQFAALPKPYREAIKAFVRAQAGNGNGH